MVLTGVVVFQRLQSHCSWENDPVVSGGVRHHTVSQGASTDFRNDGRPTCYPSDGPLPPTCARRGSHTVEVFDLFVGNLVDLGQLGELRDRPTAFPDTMGEFEAFLPQLIEDPDFHAVRAKLRSYAQIRRPLAEGRTLVAHNDIWGAHVAVPRWVVRARG